MSGICSRHQGHEPDCRACNTDVREVLPDYDQKVAEAEAAGLVTCECGFRFYRTTLCCPACGQWTWIEGGHRVVWPFHTAGHEGYGKRDWIGFFEYVDAHGEKQVRGSR